MAGVKPTHNWRLPEPHTDATEELAREIGIPELAARLLCRRGLKTAEAARGFLEPSPANLLRPDTLPDIAAATERITTAIRNRERILVYGDYDVDGVTGTALLTTVFAHLGADVLYYLPRRDTEGYGFSAAGVEFCRSNGVRLVVTNDCGSSDHSSVAAARDAGIDVVITDHHELKAGSPESALQLPAALALVNPKRPDSKYPFRELAGVGVAFKLAWSVLRALDRPRAELTDLLDLVGLGTIADVVPLTGENRILARLGLNAIRSSTRPGLKALMEVAGIADRPLSTREVGFMLGPRINAAGRVGSADKAVRLLLTTDAAEAQALAAELNTLNRSRQTIEEAILNQALEVIESERLSENRAVVVGREGWHEGVIGIVAARLVDRLHRPCVVVALKGDTGKGSGRSVTGFDLYSALSSCAGLLQNFGGHRYAAGLNVRRDLLPDFSAALNQFAAALPEEVFQPSLHIDAVAAIEEVDDALVAALERFEPFGPDNERPLFASLGLDVVGYPRRVGKNHLKLRVRAQDRVLDAIAWGRSRELLNIDADARNHLDICYTVERRTYAGRTSTQLTLRDLRTAAQPGS